MILFAEAMRATLLQLLSADIEAVDRIFRVYGRSGIHVREAAMPERSRLRDARARATHARTCAAHARECLYAKRGARFLVALGRARADAHV